MLTDLYEEAKKIGVRVGNVHIYNKGDNLKKAIIDLQNNGNLEREVIIEKMGRIEGINSVKFIS